MLGNSLAQTCLKILVMTDPIFSTTTFPPSAAAFFASAFALVPSAVILYCSAFDFFDSSEHFGLYAQRIRSSVKY